MRIIVSTTTPDIEASLDPRFGRAAYFVAVDPATMEWEAFPNPAMAAAGGAGTQAAQFIASQGAQAAISGDFGPNAYMALQAAGIQMFVSAGATTARAAVEAYNAGTLQAIAGPTGPALHGRGRR